ncbi:hypothetical protein HY523_00180 [Candidatus Berkelbacteria bacterium]|nr:hypothetical protein [Candidatus Berkelbacteria bacterium]
MSARQRDFFLWMSVCLLVVIGLAVWAWTSTPTPAAVQAAIRPLPALSQPEAIFTDQFYRQLDERTTNGTLPVVPAPPASPKDDPFAS